MKKITFYVSSLAFLVSTMTASLGILIHNKYNEGDKITIEHVNHTPATQAVYTKDDTGNLIPLDFTKASEKVMDAVVHIKSSRVITSNNNTYQHLPYGDVFKNDPFRNFFGPKFYQRQMPENPSVKMGQGSGVIISANGYIVTNNHVIADADDLEITMHDNRTYKATIVGRDPATDLALLQIKEKELPHLPLANSDAVKVGEWVLAVGNPFNLTSTVTAGIVSATGRNINILKEQFAVESFIQTDAAINPGNSGGALVNLQGGLVGINTAIASPTGAYSGYGFAIPSSIVNKVVADLIEYGTVQRGVLGVMVRTVDGNLKKKKELSVLKGVYVDSLLENSAAGAAGILSGDVITSINNIPIETSPKLQETIAQLKPGDKINVIINRNGKEKKIPVVLNNRRGNTEPIKKEYTTILNTLGLELESLSENDTKRLDIKAGLRVKGLFAGKIKQQTEMREGFVITHIDGKPVKSIDNFLAILDNRKGGILFEGIYEDLPGKYYYGFGI